MKTKKKKAVTAVAVILFTAIFSALSLTACDTSTTPTPPPHTHIWIDGAVLTEPDCETTGTVEQICSICGISHTPKTLPAKHSPDPVTGICTVCGEILAYNLGDTGPGGGIIYFKSEIGFTFFADADDTTGTTAHYLEAAPADLPERLAWSNLEFGDRTFQNADMEQANGGAGQRAWPIGTGLRATTRILRLEADAPAASACFNYTNNGKDDWFLPSDTELTALYNYYSLGNSIGDVTYPNYWASTQMNYMNAYDRDFVFGDYNGRNKPNLYAVRPIRAF